MIIFTLQFTTIFTLEDLPKHDCGTPLIMNREFGENQGKRENMFLRNTALFLLHCAKFNPEHEYVLRLGN